MAYRFAKAGSNSVEFAIAPLVGHTFGPLTFAVFVKLATTGFEQMLVSIEDSAFSTVREYWNIRAGANQREISGGVASDSPSSVISSTSVWYLLAVTRASGTATPRYHFHNGTAWTHENGGASQSGSSIIVSGDRLRFGVRGGGLGFFDGDVVCAGIKKADSSDATVETLSRTAWSAWTGFGFHWLIGFDTSLETAGVLQDQGAAGTGDEIAITGTTLVSDPAGWSWGAPAGPAFVPRILIVS